MEAVSFRIYYLLIKCDTLWYYLSLVFFSVIAGFSVDANFNQDREAKIWCPWALIEYPLLPNTVHPGYLIQPSQISLAKLTHPSPFRKSSIAPLENIVFVQSNSKSLSLSMIKKKRQHKEPTKKNDSVGIQFSPVLFPK